MFNKLKAMMEVSIWVLIAQLYWDSCCVLPAKLSSSANMVAAIGNSAMPNFSTGLVSAAINRSRATIMATSELVLKKLKLKPLFCWNTMAVYRKCVQTPVHARYKAVRCMRFWSICRIISRVLAR